MERIKLFLSKINIEFAPSGNNCLKLSRDSMVNFGSSWDKNLDENGCYDLIIDLIKCVESRAAWFSRDDNYYYLELWPAL